LGTIALVDGSVIDYRRQASSIVTLSGANVWTDASADPNTVLLAAATFLRTQGKSTDATYNVVMGELAYNAYLANAAVLKRGAIFNWNMDRLLPAMRASAGYADHGTVSAGSYNFNIITYPQSYDTFNQTTGVTTKGTPYIDPKTIFVVPQTCKNVLSYAAVPQLLTTGNAPVKGKWMMYNYPDLKLQTHEFGIKSAGVAIPVAVDQIYTAKVIA
jgi:hypothetical protein